MSVLTAIQSVLTADPILTMLVGVDSNGFTKIYDSPMTRPVAEEPPFVYFTILDGFIPTGTYGDADSMQPIVFQETAWGRNSLEAWNLDDIVIDALKAGDWATYLIPDHLMRLSMLETPGELNDMDTKWRQVPRRWRLDLDRG